MTPAERRPAAGELAVTVLPGPFAWSWVTALEQAGVTHFRGEAPRTPIAVTSGRPQSGLRSWVEAGGVLVVEDTDGDGSLIPRAERHATVSGFADPRDPAWVGAPGIVALHTGAGAGEVRVHEDRVVKHGLEQGRYAAVLHRRVGQGHVVWSGLPLGAWLSAHGDRLRPVAPWSAVTERASTVDKAGVAETLDWMVAHAAERAGLPMVRRAAWPEAAPSVFVLRVDVDGVFGDRARRLGEVAAALGVRATFFLNRELAERYPGDLGPWLDAHDVGQHADVHDLFDEDQSDLGNLRAGAAWVQQVTGRSPVGFVAPRGLWSPSLDRSLAALGYDWSSDFSLATEMRPFMPRDAVLQVPVHAYSPERAIRWADEHGAERPSAAAMRDHYLRHFDDQVRRGRQVHVYGHPEVLGAVADTVLPALVGRARTRGLPLLTLDQTARWWRRRAGANVVSRWGSDGTDGRIELDRDDDGVAIELVLPLPTHVILDGEHMGEHAGRVLLR